VRVVVVAEWYPSPGDPVHGIWAHHQARASIAAGAQVRVLALRRPVPPLAVLSHPSASALRDWAARTRMALRPFTLDGIRVTPVCWLGPPRPLSYGTWGWWMAPALARALDAAWPFDVLHAHCIAPTGHAAAIWCARRRQRPALVVSAHGPDMTDVPFRSALGRRATERALAAADLVLANSAWAGRRCRQLCPAAAEVEVVHLGAEVPAAAADAQVPAAASAPRPERPTIITIAHLQARKGHATVLRALAALPLALRPRYLIVGDGEERTRLEALTAALGLGELVRFTGQLPHERALELLRGCQLFVMPGVDEPFGVAFIEAMAAGLPAIGGRGEGGPEDIAAAGGGMVLVAPGDSAELASVLERLLSDEAERRSLGAAARANAMANFTWQRCGRHTVQAYRRALELREQR
jgi:teichuronic acid biosynthesis glycosyltransferase TuaC